VAVQPRVAMGANDDGATSLLLLFLSIETLRRLGGPFGALVGVVSCALLVAGLVWVIVWSSQQSEEDPTTDAASKREHTPTTTTGSVWINALVIFLILSLLTAPSCYYVPRAMRQQAEPVIVDTPPAPPEAASAKLPLVALASRPIGVHAV